MEKLRVIFVACFLWPAEHVISSDQLFGWVLQLLENTHRGRYIGFYTTDCQNL